jgi:two-component sensor histidine kinase
VRKTLSVHSHNFAVEGPPIRFSPQAALSFALVIHELATNSIKYGAFSDDGEGQVDVSWSVAATEGGPELHFIWKETGGPPVS